MSESKITINQVESNVEETVEPEFKYVGVIFESKYGSTSDNPKFYGKVYEYKTKKPYKEGQVIMIETNYGFSRVCVVKDNISESELEYKDLDNIKEI